MITTLTEDSLSDASSTWLNSSIVALFSAFNFEGRLIVITCMKKIIFLIIILFPLSLNAGEKKTTFTNEIFNKAQSDGKTVVVSSWIKYCTSCASQMKALRDVEKDFNNLVYLNFDVREKEIAKQLNIQFQTTLVIYKNNKEVYRSLGELSKDKIYKAINSVI